MAWRRNLIAGLFSAGMPLAAAEAGSWEAGHFVFSDELGGFEILSVTGSGSVDDPAVITQRFVSPEPGTLVVRVSSRGRSQFLRLSIVIAVHNLSHRTWVGFDLELQETLGQPSVYTDGLSFDQMHVFTDRVFRSDRFSTFSDLSEPHDRVRFENGHVDHGGAAQMRFFITDVTPKAEFYLRQEPQFLSAQAPAGTARRRARAARLPPPAQETVEARQGAGAGVAGRTAAKNPIHASTASF